MSKLSKAIKLAQGLTDEEKVEFADFFKVEEEVKEVKEVEVKKEVKEVKVETKKEVKQEETKPDYMKLFETMNAQIKNLTEKVEKAKPFGAKQKQLGKQESSEFDDMFNSLRSKQRS